MTVVYIDPWTRKGIGSGGWGVVEAHQMCWKQMGKGKGKKE